MQIPQDVEQRLTSIETEIKDITVSVENDLKLSKSYEDSLSQIC